MRRVRLACAILAASTAAAIPLPFTLWLSDIMSHTQYAASKSLLIAFLMCMTVAFLHAVILGLPTYFVLKRHNLITFASSTIAGFLIGAVPETLWMYISSLMHDSVNMPIKLWAASLQTFGLSGMLGGFAAWLVLREPQHKPT